MLLDDNELDDAKEALLYLSGFIGYYTNQTSVASRLLHGCYTNLFVALRAKPVLLPISTVQIDLLGVEKGNGVQ
jgi:hypothetical protein